MSPIIPTEKTFARVFFKKSKKIFCENFSILCTFRLTSEIFCVSCIFHLTSENFCVPCIFHLTSEKFCVPCTFRLTSENFCVPCTFRLTIRAKLRPSKFGVFPPFRDSIYYYRLLDSPLQMSQDPCTFQSLPKYYYLWVIHYYHTFY